MIKIYKNYKTEEILSRKIDDYGEYEEVVKGIMPTWRSAATRR